MHSNEDRYCKLISQERARSTVETKDAVPKIQRYSGTSQCQRKRKDSQVKASDLQMSARLGGGTRSCGEFSNMKDKLNAQGTGLSYLPSCKSKSRLIY